MSNLPATGKPSAPHVLYDFGPFRLDPPKRLLLREGRPLALTPRAFDILVVLIENRGRVVDKDELMRLVWADVVVEEANLTQSVFTLRKLLGDGPHEHRYIATVPRRGYQFVADVCETHPAWPPSTRPDSPARSLAVLPFAALGREVDEYMGLGLADALITRMGNIRQIVVRPTSAVRPYVGRATDPVSAGRRLGVDMVLEGSIQRAAGRIRVTVQLVSVDAGAPVWGQCFDGEDVGEALVSSLTAEEKQRLHQRYTQDHEAYDAYLRGRHQWNTRTENGLRKALQQFERAVERDPAYALAHAGLADCYTLLGSAGYAMLPPREALARARAAAVRALEIDPDLAEAHTSLALVKFRLDWDWRDAESEFRRAIELNPGHAAAHHFYGLYLSAMGRADEAIARMERAHELDPLSLIISTALGRALHFARRYDRALEQHLKTLERDPDFAEARFNLAFVYLQRSMFPQAVGELQRAIVLAGRRPAMVSVLGYVYALSGDRAQARRTLDELDGLSSEGEIPTLYLAYPLIGLGDKDRVFDLLDKAYEERSGLLVYLKVEPIFDSLRDDPRFDDLLRRMDLSDRPIVA